MSEVVVKETSWDKRKVQRELQDSLLESVMDERERGRKIRMKFLLRQSDVFRHFLPDDFSNLTTPVKKKSNVKSPSRRLQKDDDDLEDEEEEEETQVLRLQVQPPSIVNGKMRGYQIEGLNWLINLHRNHVNGILADEMGLGKTLQTISLLGYVKDFEKKTGPHLVIAPKSTLLNWRNEFKRWLPSIRARVFQGTKDERARLAQEVFVPSKNRNFDVCITSYEIAIREKACLRKIGWNYLVIDEAHRIKNENALLSRVVRTFVTLHRLLITGTPLQNNLHELWALLNFLLPELFHDSEQFDDWFDLKTDDDKKKETLIHQLHKILRPFMIRRLKVDVATDLPPKIQRYLYVGMSEMQRYLYKNILMREADVFAGLAGGTKTKMSNIVMQLRKTAAHPYLFPGVEDRNLDPMGEHVIENCGKMVLLDKLLKKLKRNGHRVLIFSLMTRVLDILEDYCTIRGFKFCRIDGGTNGDDRQEMIDEYNKEGSEKFVFLLSTRAGGLGINLQTADTVILYDSDWNPQVDLQAMDRAHRIGQKRTVNVYRLLTENTIEEKIIERAELKLRLDAVVVQQGRLPEQKKALSKEEMSNMVQYGANEIFRAKGSMISDEDIDLILSKGEERTAKLQKQMDERFGKVLGENKQSTNLLDFKIDSTSMQLFEGVDYAEKKKRQEELKKMIEETRIMNEVEAANERRQRAQKVNYDEKAQYRELSEAIRKANRGDPKSSNKTRSLNAICRKYNIPRPKDVPRVYSWMLLDVERLRFFEKIEQERFGELVMLFRKYDEATSNQEDVPRPELPETLLPADLYEEQSKLLSCPFLTWRRTDILAFVQATEQCGRHNYAGILSHMKSKGCKNKTVLSVKQYSERFWTVGHLYLKKWKKYEARLLRAEEKNKEMESIRTNMNRIVSGYEYPYHQMCLDPRLHPRKGGHLEYTPNEDRFLAVWVTKNGLGRPEDLRRAVRSSSLFVFASIFLIRTGEELERRALKVMRSTIKEHARLEALKDEQRVSASAAAAAIGANELANRVLSEMRDLMTKYSMTSSKKRPLTQRNTSSSNSKSKTKKEKRHGVKPNVVPSRLMGSLVKLIDNSKRLGIIKLVEKFQIKHASANVSKRQLRMKIREVASKKTAHSDWIINEPFRKYLTPKKKKRKTPVKSNAASSTDEPDAKRPKKLDMDGSAIVAMDNV